MDDSNTTVEQLRRRVADFVAARDWQIFHTPQNLSAAIAVEAAELQEPFLWMDSEQAEAALASAERRAAVVDELADVLIYALSMANALDIEVTAAVLDKLARNEQRFPAERWRGRAWEGGKPACDVKT